MWRLYRLNRKKKWHTRVYYIPMYVYCEQMLQISLFLNTENIGGLNWIPLANKTSDFAHQQNKPFNATPHCKMFVQHWTSTSNQSWVLCSRIILYVFVYVSVCITVKGIFSCTESKIKYGWSIWQSYLDKFETTINFFLIKFGLTWFD